MRLDLPASLPAHQRSLVSALAERNLAAHGDGLLGLVLTGSAGRGLATSRSDLDVFVVLTDEAASGRATDHSPDVDEIPVSWSELTAPGEFGSEDWYARWAFAWAPVLLDRTSGSLAAAVLAQARVDDAEAERILIEHDRLDGWVNYAYRALKSDRDGRALERRLDAAESVPWLLDTIWSLAGRVRPYHKYLPWELRAHPLPGWPADVLLPLLERTLDGDPAAVRETFARVSAACAAHDAERGRSTLSDVITGWGAELDLLRPQPSRSS